MALYLLDSDAVIDYLYGRRPSVELLAAINARGDQLCICDVVAVEVHTGLRAADRTTTETFLESCHFLSTPLRAAQRAGDWRYSFARRGIAVALTDAMVAATAHFHGATVVTGNVRDYPMDEIDILPLPR